MKKLFALICIVIFQIGYSCSCESSTNIFNEYSSSDLVADITVTNVRFSPEKELQQAYYVIDVKYNKLYKGKQIGSFHVYGKTIINGKQNGIGTSCSLSLSKGDRMILFYKNDEINSIHFCTPKIREKITSRFTESKKILEKISKTSIKTNYKNFIIDTKYDSETGKNTLSHFDGINAKNSFALFEVTMNTNGTFKTVDYLQKFNSQFDEEILEYLQKSNLLKEENFEISQDEKFILAMHYYKSEKKNKSFISFYFL
ncbi:hypothetical protein NZ698_10895 [Chryseobacterium sp. PBS4-4]|uniref:Tissue inhibitor of metalloproteinase n=1 Tax=Chryseobacterium edaphi TaxID=2976532 RepID=A0ABT2W667_9FLAO|nr:hypothetical protein [Chryseobacterium edaphi]MCU7617706.1 hypothetical protein [Chryseobacterium edaphi]